MTKKERAGKIAKVLKPLYGGAVTPLRHGNPFQLLVAVILSAQCTDERVNLVTPALFKKYPAPKDFVAAPLGEIEKLIHSTGFYRSKALAIKKTSETIMEKFGGRVPATMAELLTLRGVARKTANVVLSEAFGLTEGFVVDTHVKRLAFRMGLTRNTDPVKIERDMMALLDRKDWRWFSLALVLHGRAACSARKPDCGHCQVSKICPKTGVAADV
ncbi:MAG: endonuclease III [Elusimicrobiaceae bacterium]|jgi:endonuclease-3